MIVSPSDGIWYSTRFPQDFAQVGVLKTYSLSHNKTLPDGWSSDCMSNQLKFMDRFSLFDSTSLFGPTCAIQPSDPGARCDSTILLYSLSSILDSRHTTPPSQTQTQPEQGSPLTPITSVPTAVPVGNTGAGVKNAALTSAILSRWRYASLGLSIVGWLSL